ncbi:MAG: response regulator [Ruminococcus sp.]|nr:response regulator [Ruminococcus sp.]
MSNHIIVVDDDSTNLKIAGRILSRNEMRVTALSSGKALLDCIGGGESADLILLDIMMPEMDGFETLDRLRELEKTNGSDEIPVIFLTADETSDTEKQGFEAGVSDYIRKPFDPEILLRRVGNIISKQHKLRSLRTEAETDKLTGFLNKSATNLELSKVCLSAQGALLMIDLDSFKLVNDIHGHKMGDNILISFAQILSGAVPEGSRLGRIGGDEFVAFAAGMTDPEEVKKLTERLNAELVAKAKELMGKEMDIPLGTSVGGVFVPKHGNDYDTLLKLADKALYTVKKNGKHGSCIYQADAYSEDAPNVNELDISRISEILGERSIPNVALQLDRDAFSYVYRYVMRYMTRNQKSVCKVLFTLTPGDGITDVHYKDLCDEFGNHIRESLRKSDILMRSRYNQYFVLLTDIRKDAISFVTGNILRKWTDIHGRELEIGSETEFVAIGENAPVRRTEFRIAAAAGDTDELREIGGALSKAGFRVSAVKSEAALARLLEENTPDLVIIDTDLPDAGGFIAAERLRTSGKTAELPIVFISSDDSEQIQRRVLSLGALDLIKKPFLPELLMLRIRNLAELAHCRSDHR